MNLRGLRVGCGGKGGLLGFQGTMQTLKLFGELIKFGKQDMVISAAKVCLNCMLHFYYIFNDII